MSVRVPRIRRGVLAAAVLAAGALVALLAAGLIGSSSRVMAGPAGLPIVETDPAVVIEGMTLAGDELSINDLRGRPIFVNVWASW